MKRACVMLLGMMVLTGCPREQEPTTPPPPSPAATVLDQPLTAEPGEIVLTFAIGGMTCEGCQQTVHDALAATPGVKRASVSLEQNKAWVVADVDRAPTADGLVEAVEAKAYEATPVVE